MLSWQSYRPAPCLSLIRVKWSITLPLYNTISLLFRVYYLWVLLSLLLSSLKVEIIGLDKETLEMRLKSKTQDIKNKTENKNKRRMPEVNRRTLENKIITQQNKNFHPIYSPKVNSRPFTETVQYQCHWSNYTNCNSKFAKQCSPAITYQPNLMMKSFSYPDISTGMVIYSVILYSNRCIIRFFCILPKLR